MTSPAEYSGFEPSVEVSDPDRLFGHSEPGALLDDLLNELALGSSFHLYGERRSGKTSVLRCLMRRLRIELTSRIAIYLNYRTNSSVRGAANAHRCVLAHLHAASVAGGRIVTGFRDLPQDERWEKSYAALQTVPDYEVPGALCRYVDALSETGAGVVLLIDEYEHLILKTYGGEAGAFFVIRDLSTRGAVSHVKPLCFVIAGAEPWQEICEICGSPELNTATTGFNVGGIPWPSFARMWEQCVEESSPGIRGRVRASGVDAREAYDLAGGWPYYGKVIGHALAGTSGSVEKAEAALIPHFEVVWRRLSGVERRALLSGEEGQLNEATAPVEMLRRGLLTPDGDGGVVPAGRLWSRFVRSRHGDDVSIEDLRLRVLARLDELEAVIVADDELRVAMMPLCKKVRRWAQATVREVDLKAAMQTMSRAYGREHEAIKEIGVAMRVSSVVEVD